MLAARIASFPLFSALSTEKRDEMVKQCEVKSFSDGEMVYRRGDNADGMYIILLGTLEAHIPIPEFEGISEQQMSPTIWQTNSSGKPPDLPLVSPSQSRTEKSSTALPTPKTKATPVELTDLPGLGPHCLIGKETEYIGDEALFGNHTRLCTVIARGRVSVYFMPGKAFRAVLGAEPSLSGLSELSTAKLLARFRQVSLFNDLSETNLANLAALFHLSVSPPGTEILREGLTSDCFFILLQGHVEVLMQTPNGDDALLASERAGFSFGEMCLFGYPSLTTVRTTQSSLLCVLKTSRFNYFLELFPHLRENMHSIAAVYIAERLARVPLFSTIISPDRRCAQRSLMALASLCNVARAPHDTVIMKEGDEGDRLYIILRGEVEVGYHISSTTYQVLNHCKSGECFGEMALIENQPRSATVRTVRDTLFLTLSRARFKTFLNLEPSLGTTLRTIAMGRALSQLKSIKLFQALRDDQFVHLYGLLKLEYYKAGKMLFSEGDSGDKMYMIMSGCVEVQVNAKNGAHMILARRQAGDYVGEMALLEKQPRSASVYVSENCLVYSLARSKFDMFIRIAPSLRDSIEPIAKERMASRLSAIPLFRNLTESHQRQLTDLLRLKVVLPDTVLFSEGGPASYFYVLLRGSVVALATGASGQEEVIASYEPYDYFGEMAILENQPQFLTMKSVDHCLLFVLRREHFFELISLDTSLRDILRTIAAERLHDRLSAITLFDDIDIRNRNALSSLFRLESYPRDGVVFEAGSPANKFYIIVNGSVGLWTTNARGAAVLQCTRSENECFGEIALTHASSTQNVKALCQTRALIYSITRMHFEKFACIAPILQQNALRMARSMQAALTKSAAPPEKTLPSSQLRQRSQAIIPYLPQRLARFCNEKGTERPIGCRKPLSEPIKAAVIFADVSGFTPITEQFEKLSSVSIVTDSEGVKREVRHSGEGAQKIAELLNTAMEATISIITSYGGDVVKFAGDAILAVFEASEEDSLQDVTRAALHCSMQLREALLSAPLETQGFDVDLKVGVGVGDCVYVHVGGHQDKWQYLVMGDALRQMATAEGSAEKGQVVVSSEVVALLTSQAADFTPTDNSCYVCNTVRFSVSRKEPTTLVCMDSEFVRMVRSYSQREVEWFLLDEESGSTNNMEWLMESRVVTSIFARLSGLSADVYATETLNTLNIACRIIQSFVSHYDGSISKFLVDDKGLMLHAAFGLPSSNQWECATRATMAFISIQEELKKHELSLEVGITTGNSVFCGSVGSQTRLEYTMHADVVNLAARLMGNSKRVSGSQFLCDEATFTQASKLRIEFRKLPPIMVKGKTEPIPVWEVKGAKPITSNSKGLEDSEEHGSAMQAHNVVARVAVLNRVEANAVGRKQEMQILMNHISALYTRNRRGVSFVIGKPGVGKTRLMTDLYSLARNMCGERLRLIWGNTDLIDWNTPFHIWSKVFIQILTLDSAPLGPTDHEKWNELLRQRLPESMHIHLPLLNSLLPTNFPENSVTSVLSDHDRANNLKRILLFILQQEGPSGFRTLLVLDDTQWMDSSSWSLCTDIVNSVREGLLVVLLARFIESPEALAFKAFAFEVEEQASFLNIERLSECDTAEFVAMALAVKNVDKQLRNMVYQKTGGHPLFIRELMLTLTELGKFQINDVTSSARLDPTVDIDKLPDRVHELITARIASFPAVDQLVLKTASVFTRPFRVEDLLGIISESGVDGSQVTRALERLPMSGLLMKASDSQYVFKHAIIRDVAYAVLLYAQRQELHRRVAEYLERTRSDNAVDDYSVLAHHWGNGGALDKQLKYIRLAGEMSMKNYANREAIKLLEEALTIDAEINGEAELVQRGQLLRMLAEAYYHIGDMRNSKTFFGSALSVLKESLPLSIWGVRWSITVESLRQAFFRCLPSTPKLASAAQTQLHEEAALTWLEAGEMFYFNEELEYAMLASMRSMNLAEPLGDTFHCLARGYGFCALATGMLSGLLATFYSKKALKLCQNVNHAPTLTYCLLAIGVYSSTHALWNKALSCGQLAESCSHKIGMIQRWEEAVGLQGYTYTVWGRYDKGLACYTNVYRSASKRSDAQWSNMAMLGMSVNLMEMGRTTDALKLVQQVEAVTGTLDIWKDALLALLLLQTGDLGSEAWGRASAGMEKMRAILLFPFFSVYSFHALSEFYLSVAEKDVGRRFNCTRADAISRASKVSQWNWLFLVMGYPVSYPRYYIYRGRLYALQNKIGKARECWQQGLKVAVQNRMPEDVASLTALLDPDRAVAEKEEVYSKAMHTTSGKRRQLTSLPPVLVACTLLAWVFFRKNFWMSLFLSAVALVILVWTITKTHGVRFLSRKRRSTPPSPQLKHL